MAEIIHTELAPGTTLSDGKYIIENTIGSGGFGITYAARHAKLDQQYAIKEFFLNGFNVRNSTTNHVSLQGIEETDYNQLRQKFIEEAKTLASLNHDAVVKVIDIFDENGTAYMVMPFVEGNTLQDIVEAEGPLTIDIAVNYIVLISEALAYIHGRNILHRDVTPDNIIVTPEQKVVLIDFGSARKFINDKTQRHTTIVKRGYAPLEQYSAKSRKGAYTDIYSLGALFYYILTGVRPIDATERTLEKMPEPAELNPSVPLQMNAVIMKAMEMDASKRYQNVNDLMDDIFSGNFPESQEKREEEPTTPVSQNKSKRFLIALAVLLAVVAVVILSRRKESPANSESPVDSHVQMAPEHETEIPEAEDSYDPADLYEIAVRATESGLNESMDSLWINELVPSGDVDKYLVSSKSNTSARFAFVCAAKAYDLLGSRPATPETDSLKMSLEHMLDSLQQIAPHNMKYRKNELKNIEDEAVE